MSDIKTPCTGRYKEFFADGIGNETRAERLCRGGPLLDGCLEDAIRNERTEPAYMRVGVWGGTTPKQRTLIAKKGTGHRDAHRLQHIARGEDPADCAQCTPAEQVAA